MSKKSDALKYHSQPASGKLAIQATRPPGNLRDLALAFTQGVRAACEAIHAGMPGGMPLTVRQNLVARLSKSTAVPGPVDIGSLISKPILEGERGLSPGGPEAASQAPATERGRIVIALRLATQVGMCANAQ
ncbi:hypothetical protein ACQKJ1_25615 [Methylorubrum rhodesianum]|uniref:hypothetical protein n=1 Tax=Methylorubrum rhodesianum TaxID=29427 RepID=UPI003CFDA28A